MGCFAWCERLWRSRSFASQDFRVYEEQQREDKCAQPEIELKRASEMRGAPESLLSGSGAGEGVGEAKRTGERSEKWSVFGSAPALLTIKEVLPGVRDDQSTAGAAGPALSPATATVTSSLCHTKGSLWRRLWRRWWRWWGVFWMGSRERHGILMGVERAGEEVRWWGWMEEARTAPRVRRRHHCRGLFI